MRTFLFLSFVCLACSQSPTSNDAGPDAGATDAPSDSPVADAGDSGGCAPASATLTGTMLGQTLTPKDAVSFEAHTTEYEAVVVITDFTGTCALGNDFKKNSNVLSMVYLSSSTPLTPAKFDLAQSTVWDAQYAQYDATCNSPQGESSTGGTITITSVDACGITGSYDLTLNSDHVTGAFTAPSCNNPSDGGTGACQ